MPLGIRHSLAGLAFVALLAGSGCSSSSSDAPSCKSNGQSCTTGSQCCSGSCPSGVCEQTCFSNGTDCTSPSQCCSNICNTSGKCGPLGSDCKGSGNLCGATSECCEPLECNVTCQAVVCWPELGHVCGADGDCCSTNCGDTNHICVRPASGAPPVCATTGACTQDWECCSGDCNNGSCGATVPGGCKHGGDSCTAATAGDCCSEVCDATNRCTSDVICKGKGESCVTGPDCCSQTCSGSPTKTCADDGAACKPVGDACTGNGECCSAICGTALPRTCQPIPPGGSGFTCKTLGTSCAASTECCSKSCQGGACTGVSTCSAYGDVCYYGPDCCSGWCDNGATTTPAATPGRCMDPPGGCTAGGNPCDGPSNCCTRLCKNLGGGANACAIASGCRMTGDFCDATAACCGGSPDDSRPSGYEITCDTQKHVCDNGTACNPPGNICGGSGTVNASQNCCDGKKEVCKADSAGIMRCWGGCPGGVCPTGCDTGYTGEPGCCIAAGNVCQFSDQCCNDLPCVPDPSDGNVLKCGGGTITCDMQGELCDPAAPDCCAGLTCTQIPNFSGCKTDGAACTGSADCCSRVCDGGTQQCVGSGPASMCLTTAPPPQCREPGASCVNDIECCTRYCFEGTCGSCYANGASCTSDGQCCSTWCDATDGTGNCATRGGGTSCVEKNGTCTTNADCCTTDPTTEEPLTCDIDPGATSGTCIPPDITEPPPTCAATGGACSESFPCCRPDDWCNPETQVCGDPPAGCQDVAQSCSSDGDCCNGLQCFSSNTSGGQVACLPADTDCSCEVRICKNTWQACTSTDTCCTGYCANVSDESWPTCTTSTGCACVPNL